MHACIHMYSRLTDCALANINADGRAPSDRDTKTHTSSRTHDMCAGQFRCRSPHTNYMRLCDSARWFPSTLIVRSTLLRRRAYTRYWNSLRGRAPAPLAFPHKFSGFFALLPCAMWRLRTQCQGDVNRRWKISARLLMMIHYLLCVRSMRAGK